MTSARSDASLRHVLLAFDTGPPVPQSLAMARTLVETLGAELAGLFVEDINLLRLAALPFTREVGVTSGVSRPIELADVERTLRAQAEVAKRRLSELAAELSVPWSFRIERGNILQQVLAQMTESVAAVVLPSRPSRKLQPVSRAGPLRARARRLLVLWDRSAGQTQTVAVALRLAQAQGAAMTLAMVGDERSTSDAPPEALANLLAPAPPSLRVLSLPRAEADVLARQLRATGCDLLILNRRVLHEDPGQMRALIEGVGSPVVLLG